MKTLNLNMKLILLIIMITIVDVSAQSNTELLRYSTSKYVRSGLFLTDFDNYEKGMVKGTKLLLDSFEIEGVVISSLNEKYKIENINIDLVNAKFVSKISKDSIFEFDSLKGVFINNRKYLRIEGKIMEVIYENNDFSFYKDKSKSKSKPVVNKMSNVVMKQSEWIGNNKFYYKEKNGSLISFKPSKKRILNLFDPNKHGEVKLFVKNNSLSFKETDDISRIFKYYFSI